MSASSTVATNGEARWASQDASAIRAVHAKEKNAVPCAILIVRPRKTLIFKASASWTVRSLMNQDEQVIVKYCQPQIPPIQCKGRNRTSWLSILRSSLRSWCPRRFRFSKSHFLKSLYIVGGEKWSSYNRLPSINRIAWVNRTQEVGCRVILAVF